MIDSNELGHVNKILHIFWLLRIKNLVYVGYDFDQNVHMLK